MSEIVDYSVSAHLQEVEFETICQRRMMLKDQINKIAAEVKDLDIQVGAALDVAGLEVVSCIGHSVGVIYNRGRRKFDQKGAKASLVERGVSADLVAEVFDGATSRGNPFTTVSFRKQ